MTPTNRILPCPTCGALPTAAVSKGQAEPKDMDEWTKDFTSEDWKDIYKVADEERCAAIEEVISLQNKIAQLEAENKQLREGQVEQENWREQAFALFNERYPYGISSAAEPKMNKYPPGYYAYKCGFGDAYRLLKGRNAELEAENKQLREGQVIVKELAEWSRKYPRGRIYHPNNQESMDGELITIEERAKNYFQGRTATEPSPDKNESV